MLWITDLQKSKEDGSGLILVNVHCEGVVCMRIMLCVSVTFLNGESVIHTPYICDWQMLDLLSKDVRHMQVCKSVTSWHTVSQVCGSWCLIDVVNSHQMCTCLQNMVTHCDGCTVTLTLPLQTYTFQHLESFAYASFWNDDPEDSGLHVTHCWFCELPCVTCHNRVMLRQVCKRSNIFKVNCFCTSCLSNINGGHNVVLKSNFAVTYDEGLNLTCGSGLRSMK